MKTYQNDNTNPKETPLVYYAGDKRQRDNFVKQTFNFNGNEYNFNDIFYINKINKFKTNEIYTIMYEIVFKIFINNTNTHCSASICFDTLEEAEQSRNELIQKWNEVLNEI